ncbi:MAG: CHAT domain-containing protein [Acidobacteriota bacterium]|nr:CHAT domain-containing protein [Acidobacteriota bacterium]
MTWRAHRVSAAPKTGYSPRQSRAEAVIARGRELSGNGHFQDAAQTFIRAAEIARQDGNIVQRAQALVFLSGCRIRLFDYRGAQRAADQARFLALKARNATIAGAAVVHLATIYSQLGEFQLASKQAAYAADLLKDSPNKEYLAKALLIYANIQAGARRNAIDAERVNGDSAAERRDTELIVSDYQRGIDVAHRAGLSSLEANLWEELGESLLLVNHPDEAEDPLRKAYLLEAKSFDENALAINKEHQAELQLQKHNYQLALRLIDQAFASPGTEFRTTPQFYPLHIRGVLLANLNRKDEALQEFRKAVDSATEWRQGALPGDVIGTRTVVTLHDVYHDYAQLAAELSLANHDPALARQGLEALAENRAASLRAQMRLALSQKQRLPQQYLTLLAQLQSAQARVTLGDDRPQDKAKLEQIRLEVNGFENEFSLKLHELSQINERNDLKNSLRDIQVRLSKNQLLLSFSLGRIKSFLWAVAGDQVNVYQLPGKSEIETTARQFSQAVQGRQDVSVPGKRLSQDLFGSVPPDLLRKPEWLIVGDGVLLGGLAFPSLPDPLAQGKFPLTESHSLRFLPSELLLLSRDRSRPERRFVGIGDPIYNMADSRRKDSPSSKPRDANRAGIALARLAGSDREIRTAALESGMASSQLLLGPQATVSGLEQAISKTPRILHFAVHVVNPNASGSGSLSSRAALALSLTQDNMPELLTAEAIATLRVPGTVVILDGCSSQAGEILPSAGVMGLSRAWLLAGAEAVVVSAWPTPDDSGRFFSSFYSNFKNVASGTLAQRTALALEKAQLEMQHSDGYRSSPKFWAAYSVISKE